MKSDNLELREVSVAREGAPLLPPISEQLRTGDILTISGRNGSGKSSLLKCIAGLLPSAGGDVLWNGETMTRSAAYPRNIVYLGHKKGIEPSLSVLSHLKFWARAYDQRELIGAALHYFDLTDIADAPVQSLSAGWQQRVALARLILQPGKLWLLDEPTAGLDADGVNLLRSLIETRSERGGIILVASHTKFQGDKVRELDLDPMAQGGPHVLHLH